MAARKTTAKPAPDPGDKLEAAPERVRGYYTTPYGRFMSVTTIIDNGVAKPGLPYWYASETARRAIDSIPRLSRLRGQVARDEALTWLKGAANEKKDAAANLGSWVHRAAEAHVLGSPFEEPSEEQAPFLAALLRFLNDHDPQFEAAELTVAHPGDEWAGTTDAYWRLPRTPYGHALVLGDYKTGKNVHPEAALQLAAYQRAKVGWLRDGQEITPPKVDAAVVVHIRPDKYPDTGYRVIPVHTTYAVYQAFLGIRNIAVGWTKGVAKTALGEPLALDIDATEVA